MLHGLGRWGSVALIGQMGPCCTYWADGAVLIGLGLLGSVDLIGLMGQCHGCADWADGAVLNLDRLG